VGSPRGDVFQRDEGRLVSTYGWGLEREGETAWSTPKRISREHHIMDS